VRIVIGWQEINAYMAACFRELAKEPGLDLLILAGRPGALMAANGYDDGPFADLPCRLLDANGLSDPRAVADLVHDFRPDVIVLPGWSVPAFVRLAFDPRLSGARFVLAIDTPREDTWRQRLARLKIGRYVDRMERVVVPGERSWQFALRLLRVPERRLRRGVYGVNFEQLAPTYEQRLAQPGGWPRRFLFAGRYMPIKGLDVLRDAYRRYRELVPDPWPLTCCGKGELAPLLAGEPGIEDLGFVQPEDLAGILPRQAVFVLPSRKDPWPLAVVEHAAAGLPIVCTEACGSAVELVRPGYNGCLVATADAGALAAALVRMHRQHDALPLMGRRSRELAAPYSAQMWARRWLEMFGELTECAPAVPPG
jgi:glycosyltransferase involved in cell wall biosynthesis